MGLEAKNFYNEKLPRSGLGISFHGLSLFALILFARMLLKKRSTLFAS